MRGISMLLYFVGQNELVFESGLAPTVLNICMKNRIVYRGLAVGDDGKLRLWCTPYMAYILKRECAREGISVEEGSRKGLLYQIAKYRRRAGLFIGGICALILILLSDNYIWDIRVSGNERVSYTQLTKALAESGLCVGSRVKTLDVDAIETRTVLSCKDISWITINIQGTYANVQIRESGNSPEESEAKRPSNLVALRDGQIEFLEIFSGNAVVKWGDVVRKGDVLVSGVRDSNHYGMFVTRSSGRVYARTKRSFKVEIPLEYEKKVLTESKISEKSIIFFNHEIKVFENAGNIGSSCDTIKSIKLLRSWGGDRLPVGVKTTRVLYYESEQCRYTENEAMEIAYCRLSELIWGELRDAELLSKNITWEITPDAYILYCNIECIENIAVTEEFDFVG